MLKDASTLNKIVEEALADKDLGKYFFSIVDYPDVYDDGGDQLVVCNITSAEKLKMDAAVEKEITKHKKRENFSTVLNRIMNKKKIYSSEICKKLGYSIQNFDERIICSKEPKRVTVLRLCVALETNKEEINELYSAAGYNYPSPDNIGEKIVFACMTNGYYDIDAIDESLLKHNANFTLKKQKNTD